MVIWSTRRSSRLQGQCCTFFSRLLPWVFVRFQESYSRPPPLQSSTLPTELSSFWWCLWSFPWDLTRLSHSEYLDQSECRICSRMRTQRFLISDRLWWSLDISSSSEKKSAFKILRFIKRTIKESNVVGQELESLLFPFKCREMVSLVQGRTSSMHVLSFYRSRRTQLEWCDRLHHRNPPHRRWDHHVWPWHLKRPKDWEFDKWSVMLYLLDPYAFLCVRTRG